MADDGSTTMALIHRFGDSVLQSLYMIQRKTGIHGWRTTLASFVLLLQMLSFSLSSAPGRVWSTTIEPIQVLANWTSISGELSLANTAAYLGLYYFAIIWVASYLALFLWAALSLAGGSLTVWPLHLRILQLQGSFSATVGFIPILTLLLSGMQCESQRTSSRPDPDHADDIGFPSEFWYRTVNGACFAGGHLAQTVIVAILILGFIVLCSLFSWLVFDGASLSVSLAAKSSGRAELSMLLMKVVLVVIVKICFMNRVHTSMASVFLLSAVCAAIGYANPAADLAIAFYLGALPVAYVGARFADWRAQQIMRAAPAELRNPYEFELKIRYIVDSVLYGDPLRSKSDAAVRGGVNLIFGSGAGDSDGSGDDRDPEAGDAQRTGDTSSLLASSAMRRQRSELEAEVDAEARMTIARAMLSPALLASVSAIWKAAAARFRHSSILHVFMARFYGTLVNNRHMQMSHLLHAERRHPPLDVQYAVFAMRKMVEDNAGGEGAGQLSALSRVTFEKLMAEARKETMDGLQGQADLWMELQADVPDINRLHSLAQHVTASIYAAEAAFTTLLRLNPRSLLVLRLFASFKLHVCNDPEKAAMLISEAERMEDQQSKDAGVGLGSEGEGRLKLLGPSHIDVMADQTGIITLGASPANLGLMLSASAFACRMFGYSASQLERRNISTLLPQPIARMHDSYLRRYLQTGEGQVVDYTRVVFGLHRQGHIFPLLMAVREAPASHGEPAFVGLLRSIQSQEDYILLNEGAVRPVPTAGSSSLHRQSVSGGGDAAASAPPTDLVITAATLKSLGILGLEASVSTRGDQQIADWIPMIYASWQDMRSEKGAPVRVVKPAWLQDDERDMMNDEDDASSRAFNDFDSDDGDARSDAPHGGYKATSNSNNNSRRASAAAARGRRASQGEFEAEMETPSETWIRAFIQHVPLPGAPHFYVLAWSHLSSDTATIRHAEAYEATISGAVLGSSHDLLAGIKHAGATAATVRRSNSMSIKKQRPASIDTGVPTAAPTAHGAAKKATQAQAASFMQEVGTPPNNPTADVEADGAPSAAAAAVPKHRVSTHMPPLPSGHPPVAPGSSGAGCPVMINRPGLNAAAAEAASQLGITAAPGITTGTSARAKLAPGASPAGSISPSADDAINRMMAGVQASEPPKPRRASAGGVSRLPSTAYAEAHREVEMIAQEMQQKGISEDSTTGLNMRLRMLRSLSNAADNAVGSLSPGSASGAAGGHGIRGRVSARMASTEAHSPLPHASREHTAASHSLPGAVNDHDSHAIGFIPASKDTHTNLISSDAVSDAVLIAKAQGGPRRPSSVRFQDAVANHVHKTVAATANANANKNANRSVKRPGARVAGRASDDSEAEAGSLVVLDANAASMEYLPPPPSAKKTAIGGAGQKTGASGYSKPIDNGRRSSLASRQDVRDGGDRGSYKGSQASSAKSSGRRMVGILRKVIDAPNKQLMPGLRRLWHVSMAMTIGALALATGLVIFAETKFDYANELVSMVVLAGDSLEKLAHIAVQTATMVVANKGWGPATDNAFFQALQQSQEDVADSLLKQHLRLYQFSQSKSEYAGTYVTRNVPMSTFFTAGADGSLRSSVESVSLYEAGIRYVSAAKAVTALQRANISSATAVVQTTVTAGWAYGTVALAFNASTFQWLRAAADNSATSTALFQTTFIAMMAIIGGLAVLVFLPIAYSIESQKLHLMKTFVGLPVVVLNTLRLQTQRRLHELRVADTEASGDDDGDSSDGEQENDNGSGAGGANGDANPTEATLDVDISGEVDWDRLLQAKKQARNDADAADAQQSGSKSCCGWCCRPARNTVQRTRSTYPSKAKARSVRGKGAAAAVGMAADSAFASRPNRKHARSLVASTISSSKFFVPLVVLAVYFALLYVFSTATITDAIDSLVLATIANSRLVLVRMSMSTIRRAIRLAGPPSDVTINATVTAGFDLLDRLEWTMNFLGYERDPSSSYTLTDPDQELIARAQGCDSTCPSLSPEVSSALHQLYIGDACTFMDTYLTYEARGRDMTAVAAEGYDGDPLASDDFNLARCRAWQQGQLTRGLSNTLSTFVSAGRYLLERRALSTTSTSTGIGIMNISTNGGASWTSAPYSNPADLVSNQMYIVMEGSASYILPALHAASELYVQDTINKTASGDSVLTIMTAVMMTAFVLFMLVVYIPGLQASNRELHKQRALLLLLPPQVVITSASIQALVDHILASSGMLH